MNTRGLVTATTLVALLGLPGWSTLALSPGTGRADGALIARALPPAVSPSPTSVDSAVLVSQSRRLSLALPAEWHGVPFDDTVFTTDVLTLTVRVTRTVETANRRTKSPAADPATVCERLLSESPARYSPGTTVSQEQIAGQPGCRIGVPGGADSGLSTLVVRYPAPQPDHLPVDCTVGTDPAFIPCDFAIIDAPAGAMPAVQATMSFGIDPKRYLADMVSRVRFWSVGGDRVLDSAVIDAFAREAEALAGTATSTEDTHRLLRRFIRQLGDRHGDVVPAEQIREDVLHDDVGVRWVNAETDAGLRRVVYRVGAGSAADGQIEEGQSVETVDGFARPEGIRPGEMSPLFGSGSLQVVSQNGATRSVSLAPQLYRTNIRPAGLVLPDGVGYLELFGNTAPDWDDVRTGIPDDYAATVHGLLNQIDRPAPDGVCRWVVDLRRNEGGRIDQLLQSVGPFVMDPSSPTDSVSLFLQVVPLASNTVSTPPSPKMTTTSTLQLYDYRYTHDGSLVGPSRARSAPVAGAHQFAAAPSVAVLTSRITASAGEIVSIALRRNPEHGSQIRSFGEATRGLTTLTKVWPLFDGAALRLGVGWTLDETGAIHRAPLQPDEQVPVDWNYLVRHRAYLAGETPVSDMAAHDPVLARALAWLATQPGCS